MRDSTSGVRTATPRSRDWASWMSLRDTIGLSPGRLVRAAGGPIAAPIKAFPVRRFAIPAFLVKGFQLRYSWGPDCFLDFQNDRHDQRPALRLLRNIAL